MEPAENGIRLIGIVPKGRLYLLSFSDGYEIRATRQVTGQLGLSEGSRFTPESYAELKRILEWEWAVYCAESLLARRAYSIGEFTQRLRHRAISTEHVARIVKEFRNRGFLDDYKYALARGQSLLIQKPVGKGYVVAWLQKRLVPRGVAQKAAEELYAGVDEVAVAVDLLGRKSSSLAKFDLETARRKAYTYLSRRAISYNAARAAFDKVFGAATDKTR